jgi:hypothetical protein
MEHMNTTTYLKTVALLLIFLHKTQKAPVSVHGWARVLLGSYISSDFFLWLVHAYVDKEENLQNPLESIRKNAALIRLHHADPGNVLKQGYGFMAIDEIVSDTLTAGILVSPFASTESILHILCSLAWHILGVYNHILCHAGSRGFRVPEWVTVLRRIGVVPTMEYHQAHHDPSLPNPHLRNWSFLCGPSLLYERVFVGAGCPIEPLHLLMSIGNPISTTVLLAVCDTLCS